MNYSQIDVAPYDGPQAEPVSPEEAATDLLDTPYIRETVNDIFLRGGVDRLEMVVSRIPADHPRRTRILAVSAERLAAALIDARILRDAREALARWQHRDLAGSGNEAGVSSSGAFENDDTPGRPGAPALLLVPSEGGWLAKSSPKRAAAALEAFIARQAGETVRDADPYFQETEALLRLHALAQEARLELGKPVAPLDSVLHLEPGDHLLWPAVAHHLLEPYVRVPTTVDVDTVVSQGLEAARDPILTLTRETARTMHVHVHTAVDLHIAWGPAGTWEWRPLRAIATPSDHVETRKVPVDPSPIHAFEDELTLLGLDQLREDLARLLTYHTRARGVAIAQMAILQGLATWVATARGDRTRATRKSDARRADGDAQPGVFSWSRATFLQGAVTEDDRVHAAALVEDSQEV